MAFTDDGYIRFRCGKCDKKLKVRKEKSLGGAAIPCPRCANSVNVPNEQRWDLDEAMKKKHRK